LARRLVIGLIVQTPNEISEKFSKVLGTGLSLSQLQHGAASKTQTWMWQHEVPGTPGSGGENVRTAWMCERGTKAAKGCLYALSALQLAMRAGSVSCRLAGGHHIWLSHCVPGWHPESGAEQEPVSL